MTIFVLTFSEIVTCSGVYEAKMEADGHMVNVRGRKTHVHGTPDDISSKTRKRNSCLVIFVLLITRKIWTTFLRIFLTSRPCTVVVFTIKAGQTCRHVLLGVIISCYGHATHVTSSRGKTYVRSCTQLPLDRLARKRKSDSLGLGPGPVTWTVAHLCCPLPSSVRLR